MIETKSARRVGGHLVAESLEALGADTCFGLPGQHALGMFDGVRTSDLRYVGLRTELNAGFAADGYARVSGRPAPLLLSTGPGALISLAALMEAETSSVPVVAISSQIPRDGIGRRHGYIHELRDQLASFRHVVKEAAHVPNTEALPHLLAAAWREACTPPAGPVFLEVPVDVLLEETDVPPVAELDGRPRALPPRREELDRAALLLGEAERPAILAGGGVLRAGAWRELRALAEKLRAPVTMTYGGKGAFPDEHPLSCGSFCEDADLMEFLGEADVLLCVGTGLGEETTNHFTFRPKGRLIQIDADPEKIGANHRALGVVGDAKEALAGLLDRVRGRPADGEAEARVSRVLAEVERRLAPQGRELERGLLDTVRAALPPDAVHSWDMTILAYWAAFAFPAGSARRFLWPQGSGSLGYGWPAALGAKAALPDRAVLGIVGDGGSMYGLQEMATARQYGLDAKLLLIDDGCYGVLAEYQRDGFGANFAVDLAQPDFTAVCEAFGLPVRTSRPDRLGEDLAWAFGTDGPAVVVLPAKLEMFLPTHL
jgi:acetolactate synthase-1/2/3 large subunit